MVRVDGRLKNDVYGCREWGVVDCGLPMRTVEGCDFFRCGCRDGGGRGDWKRGCGTYLSCCHVSECHFDVMSSIAEYSHIAKPRRPGCKAGTSPMSRRSDPHRAVNEKAFLIVDFCISRPALWCSDQVFVV